MKNFDDFFLQNLSDLRAEAKHHSIPVESQAKLNTSQKKVMTLADYKEQIELQHKKPLNNIQSHSNTTLNSLPQNPNLTSSQYPQNVYYSNHPMENPQIQNPLINTSIQANYLLSNPSQINQNINPSSFNSTSFYGSIPTYYNNSNVNQFPLQQPSFNQMNPMGTMGLNSNFLNSGLNPLNFNLNLSTSEEHYYRALYSSIPGREISGELPAKEVVDFLKTSNIHKDKLKEFWRCLKKPDNNPSVKVTLNEFFLLLKMIALTQINLDPTKAHNISSSAYQNLPIFHNIEEEDAFDGFQSANKEEFTEFEHYSPILEMKTKETNDLLYFKSEEKSSELVDERINFENPAIKTASALMNYDKYNVFDLVLNEKNDYEDPLKKLVINEKEDPNLTQNTAFQSTAIQSQEGPNTNLFIHQNTSQHDIYPAHMNYNLHSNQSFNESNNNSNIQEWNHTLNQPTNINNNNYCANQPNNNNNKNIFFASQSLFEQNNNYSGSQPVYETNNNFMGNEMSNNANLNQKNGNLSIQENKESDLYNPFSPNTLEKAKKLKTSAVTNFVLELEDEHEEEFQDFQQGNQQSYRGNIHELNFNNFPLKISKENATNIEENIQVKENFKGNIQNVQSILEISQNLYGNTQNNPENITSSNPNKNTNESYLTEEFEDFQGVSQENQISTNQTKDLLFQEQFFENQSNQLTKSHQKMIITEKNPPEQLIKGNVYEIDWPDIQATPLETHQTNQNTVNPEPNIPTEEIREEDFKWFAPQLKEKQPEKPHLITKKTEDLMNFEEDSPTKDQKIKTLLEGTLENTPNEKILITETSNIKDLLEGNNRGENIIASKETLPIIETPIISFDPIQTKGNSAEGIFFNFNEISEKPQAENDEEFEWTEAPPMQNNQQPIEKLPQLNYKSFEFDNNNCDIQSKKNDFNKNLEEVQPKNNNNFIEFDAFQQNSSIQNNNFFDFNDSQSKNSKNFLNFKEPFSSQVQESNLIESNLNEIVSGNKSENLSFPQKNLLDLISDAENLLPICKNYNFADFSGNVDDIVDLQQGLFSLEYYAESELLHEHLDYLKGIIELENEKKKLVSEERYEEVITIRDKIKEIEKKMLSKENLNEILEIYKKANGRTYSAECLDKLVGLNKAEGLIQVFIGLIKEAQKKRDDIKILKEIKMRKMTFI